MKRRVKRRFRRAGRIAARRALVKGDINFLKYGEILIGLSNDDKVEEMIAACAAQAVKCGLAKPEQAITGDLEWEGFLDDVDWAKLIQTVLPFILMLL